jgi:flagellar protein FliS
MTQPAKQPYKAYVRASHTASKTRQVVMLYEGIIRFLQQAKSAMEAKDYEQRYLRLTRASDVVMGLQSCLDFDNGGKVAQTLYDFYSGVDARILSLHRTNDIAACEALIKNLKDMRDVWERIDHQSTDGKQAAMPTMDDLKTATETPVQNLTFSA